MEGHHNSLHKFWRIAVRKPGSHRLPDISIEPIRVICHPQGRVLADSSRGRHNFFSEGEIEVKLLKIMTAVAFSSTIICAQSAHTTWIPVWHSSGINVVCLSEHERSDLAKKSDKGDPGAQDKLGTDYLICDDANRPKSFALDLLQRAAGNGRVHAQFMLGEAYAGNRGVPKDEAQAVSWLKKAAAAGDPNAQNSLGVIYETTSETAKDPKYAAELFRSAAEKGVPEAQFNLAAALEQGVGIAQNYELARKWYTKAAENKVTAAEYRLGVLFDEGLGGAKDPNEAKRWLTKAADNGSEEAELRLGRKSASEARTVDSGYFQYAIGMQMLTGDGLAKDESRALVFLQKSAEAGFPPAMVQLANMYSEGKIVTKNEATALDYCKHAITRDDKYAAAYNAFAWILLTADDPKLRDAKTAREYALKAASLSKTDDPAILDTLAHAYFQTGDVGKAIETETRAATLAPKNDFIQKTLVEYKKAQQSGSQ